MRRINDGLWTLLFAGAAVGFALTAHRANWAAWRWAFLALAGTALCCGWAVLDNPIQTIVGKRRSNRSTWWIALAVAVGLSAAVAYRRLISEDYLPSALHWFAAVAVAIGVVEEVVWRGWMQGVLAKASEREKRGYSAAAVAAFSHATYKTALFVFPPLGIPRQSLGSLLTIAGLTFVFGFGLGAMRVRQGTIVAPIVFHAVFDLLVYGGCVTAPWWVF